MSAKETAGYCQTVKEFTVACSESELTKSPEQLTAKEVAFITQMVLDELQELKEAKNITEQADAFIDVIYYVCNQAVVKGINLDPLFKMVHAANMKKVGADGKVLRREDGKILKPKGWTGPEEEMGKELVRQINEGAFK